MRFGLLPLIKPLDPWVGADGKLGRLHIRPPEILVAIFDVALPFALAVADFRTLDTAAIGSVIAHRGKAAQVSRFECDGLGQNAPDAIDRQPLLICWRVLQMLGDSLF